MITRKTVYKSKYLAGKVKRYHTWMMIHSQTVGEHCWRVACIYVELFELPRAEVLYYCLHHDSGELFAGDLPFGSKIKVDGLKDAMDEAESIGLKKLGITLPNLTKQEKTRVKICDLLEMWETGEYETLSGNKYAEPIMTDTLAAVMHIAEEEDDNKQTWQIIMNWIGERSLP